MKRFIITLFLLSILGSAFAGEVNVRFEKRFFIASFLQFYSTNEFQVSEKDKSKFEKSISIFKENWYSPYGDLLSEDGTKIEDSKWLSSKEVSKINKSLKVISSIVDFDSLYSEFVEEYSHLPSVESIEPEIKEWCKVLRYDKDIDVFITLGDWSYYFNSPNAIFLSHNALKYSTSDAVESRKMVIHHEVCHFILSNEVDWYFTNSTTYEEKEFYCEAYRKMYDELPLADSYEFLTEETIIPYIEILQNWKESGKEIKYLLKG